MKNWKTTLSGILVAGLGFATYMNYISAELSGIIFAGLVSIGLIAAKDHNVSGAQKIAQAEEDELLGKRPGDR